MRLIVIDPRHVGLASKADLWLKVRPGTDGALALGLANVMIQRGWYDRDFIRTWSNGPLLVRGDTGRLLTECDLTPRGDSGRNLAWDTTAGQLVSYDTTTGRYDGSVGSLALEGEYRVATPDGDVICHPVFELYARLCRRYPPEAVEATSWIPRAQVEEAARLIWHARPVSYYAWSGHEQHANVTQTARAMSLLYALTGCFDAPGGNVLLPALPAAPITGADLPSAKRMALTLGRAERPLGPARWNSATTRDLYRAILEETPYPIRALIDFGSNLLLAHANGGLGRKALAALEFYAHADLFMTPTAELADVVLPVASCFEREALKIGFEISSEAQSHVQLRQAIVPPPGEARPDTDIVFDHRCRLSPPARPDRRHAGATARRTKGHAGAIANALRQTRRTGRQRRAARLCHAVAQDRTLFANFPRSRLCVITRFRGATGRPGGAARFGGALPADPDQRQANNVLPDSAPRATQSAQACSASGSGTASRDGASTWHRQRRLGVDHNAGRQSMCPREAE